jgi:hypothetical protein
MPAPTTPLRRAARLAIWFSPLIAATLLHLPACPYAIILRQPCPGCGLTRAARAFAHLDLDLAIAMNPISPVVLPLAGWLALEAVVLYVLTGHTKLNQPLRRNVGIALCLALFVVWIMRKYFGAFGGPVAV